MTKTELIEVIVKKTGLTKADCKKAIDAFTETITEVISMKTGRARYVNIPNFGTFFSIFKLQRIGRNPKTGKKINIPTHYTPKLIPSKTLMRIINQGGGNGGLK